MTLQIGRMACTFEEIPEVGFRIVAEMSLNEADYTVLTLESPMFFPHEHYESEDSRYLGIAVADIVIEPLAHSARIVCEASPALGVQLFV